MCSSGKKPKTIGILGAGQLGLMLSHALSALGAEVLILEPQKNAPAAVQTPFVTEAPFDDVVALQSFFERCDRVTYEFEHIPTAALREVLQKPEYAEKLWPSVNILEYAQNRISEKRALALTGAPLAQWREIQSLADFEQEKEIWLNARRAAILKTALGGYDGKGQWRLSSESDWSSILAHLRQQKHLFPMVLEEQCQLKTEISVIVGRHPVLGSCVFPVFENIHHQGILDTTLLPARVQPELAEEAKSIALRIAQQWDVRGLLCVEFFVVDAGPTPKILVNEVAPRPHNSGHITRRAMTRSQFDILAQILLDLPISSEQLMPATSWAMWNTLGDLWLSSNPGQIEQIAISWPQQLLNQAGVCEAFLYGKKEARAGRKMGHVIVNSTNSTQSLKTIASLRSTFISEPRG
ncbi:MAG: hypothetical protein RI932_2282 [Pseudomonadota bacterium]|jgi:5-(carboxyamino)imidazole ribonucleotide synthase